MSTHKAINMPTNCTQCPEQWLWNDLNKRGYTNWYIHYLFKELWQYQSTYAALKNRKERNNKQSRLKNKHKEPVMSYDT